MARLTKNCTSSIMALTYNQLRKNMSKDSILDLAREIMVSPGIHGIGHLRFAEALVKECIKAVEYREIELERG